MPDDLDLVDRLLADWARERPDLDASPMAVVGRLIALGQALTARANTALKPMDLSYSDLDVLATLRRSGPPFRLTPTALRRSVLLTSGAMTACLNRLETRGLVSREADPDDRRVLAATLTSAGQALADQAIGPRFSEASQVLAPLTGDERARLAKLLRKLCLSISAPPDQAPS